MDSAESFARLVHGANPAAANRYPPTMTTAAMDPFFDDDDDLLGSTNHTFPMQSGFPLTDSAAPPAGLGNSTVSLPNTGQPQGWSEDSFQGSASFPGLPFNTRSPTPRRRKKWKWPWDKKVEQSGERIIALNNPLMNDEFADNFVSTSKYNPVTFLPKFLKGNSLPCQPTLSSHIQHRTVLEIRQPIFSIHRSHSADTKCFPHKPVHHHRPARHRPPRIRFQRNSRRPRQCPVALLESSLTPSRNDTNLTRNSTPVLPRYSPHPPHSNHANGKTYASETSSASSLTSSSPPISFSFPHQSQKVSVSSRHPTSTGKHCPTPD